MSKTYSEKLKDPRWQKKRLSVLERDGWACKLCGDKSSTLNVHHIFYTRGEPWHTPMGLLITVCEKCHSQKHTSDSDGCPPTEILFDQIDIFLSTFWKEGYEPHDLIDIACKLPERPKNSSMRSISINAEFKEG